MPIARKPASRLDPMGRMDFDQGGCIVETSRRRRVPEILDAHDGCDAVARRGTKVRQPALEWNISDTNRFTLEATLSLSAHGAPTVVLQDAWQVGTNVARGALTLQGPRLQVPEWP